MMVLLPSPRSRLRRTLPTASKEFAAITLLHPTVHLQSLLEPPSNARDSPTSTVAPPLPCPKHERTLLRFAEPTISRSTHLHNRTTHLLISRSQSVAPLTSACSHAKPPATSFERTRHKGSRVFEHRLNVNFVRSRTEGGRR